MATIEVEVQNYTLSKEPERKPKIVARLISKEISVEAIHDLADYSGASVGDILPKILLEAGQSEEDKGEVIKKAIEEALDIYQQFCIGNKLGGH
jgi:hypothetical protein